MSSYSATVVFKLTGFNSNSCLICVDFFLYMRVLRECLTQLMYTLLMF